MRYLFIVICACAVLQISAQSMGDTTKTPYKNVIAFDVTGLLAQFFNSSTNGFWYSSPYLVSYRRSVCGGNFRASVGGSNTSSTSTLNDSVDQLSKQQVFDIKVGYERIAFQYKRWSFYYGCDALYGYNHHINRSSDFISTDRVQRHESNSFGVSPVMGVVFNLNERIALGTETCYDIYYEISESDDNWTAPVYGNHVRHSEGTQWATQFHAPVYLALRVNF